jgi:long-chain acyl-CoA synthetase
VNASILTTLKSLPPHLPALDDGALHLTYGDLQRAVVQERRWLSRLGVGRCAISADNSTRWIVTDLALLSGGNVNVPVPNSFTPAQVRHLLDDAGIDCILTDRADEIATGLQGFHRVDRSNRTGFVLFRRRVDRLPSLPQAVTRITYTSGSTGAAKGVCLTSTAVESVARSLANATAGLGITRHMCVLPLSTLLENIAGVYVPLLLGAQIHVRPLATLGMSYAGLNARLLLQAITQVQPDSLVLVPELLRVLVHATQQGWAAPSTLKFIAVGGASLSLELLQQAVSAGLPVFQGYGLSECASVVCLNTPAHNRLGSVGRPLAHASIRIDDNGEICVRGAMMSGYLGELDTGCREIRTGDLGEIDADGFLYVRGRAKNMFITSMGRNVTPEWVERELTCEPTIAHAMVTGEARPYPVALISTTGVAPAHTIEQSIERANARLPDYAQVRRWASFPETPSVANGLLTSNGRLRRNDILARHGSLLDSLYEHEVC